MNFHRPWTIFALDAEHDAYGMARIAQAHNTCMSELASARAERDIACTALCPHGLDIAAKYENAKRELAAAQALLPSVYYMDPPDGGNVDLLEQWNRMAKDALRYRWLRRNPTYLGWEHDCPPEFIDANVDAALAAPGEGK